MKTVVLFLIFNHSPEGQHEQITGKLYYTLPPNFARLFVLRKLSPLPIAKR